MTLCNESDHGRTWTNLHGGVLDGAILLGLNLKFCLASNTITNDINKTVLKMARSIRTKHYLKENGLNDNKDYEKQIYITHLNWQPPPAP
jgi:hypothetical protein